MNESIDRVPTANAIRLLALEAVHAAGKGHIGGVLSCAEILAALYGGVLREGDTFLLSKGHAAVGLYAALALKGVIPMEEMLRMNRGSMLGEHPDRSIPGVVANSGSLGHGLSVACGMAMEAKLRGSLERVFVLLGDGECWEGQVWEAAMMAAHHGLNVTVIVDRNGYAVQGATEDIVGLESLRKKWLAFGFPVDTLDGHDDFQLNLCLRLNKPRVLICRTVKGKGVSFMEGKREWHHGSISDAQMAQIREELK